MSEKFQRPPGTRDWYLGDAVRRRAVVEAARVLFEAAEYLEIVTPTFEDTRVFSRTSGEASEVVQKEMYTFQDRGRRSLTLRPEGTAGVMRAYIQDGMHRLPQPVKLWYFAPMFRYNRVQRGRLREHYQFGVEAIGSPDPAIDAEVISLQTRWYKKLGLKDVELTLNSIGDAVCRPSYVRRLIAFLNEHATELCSDCVTNTRRNPLRVLDCKNPECQAVLVDAPRITDYLCDACNAHFEDVKRYLDARAVSYILDHRLVRGLDYYERTTWEFTTDKLGAQSAVGGGGRYDGLAEQLGGPRAPGVGFGSGIERILEVLGEGWVPNARPVEWTAFAILEPAANARLFAIMDELRELGHHADAAIGKSNLRRMLSWAGSRGAADVVIVGPDEWIVAEAKVHRMDTGVERTVALDLLVKELSGEF